MANRKKKIKEGNFISKILIGMSCVYILMIFILAWTPGNNLPDNLNDQSTTIFHFLEFIILSILIILLSTLVFKKRIILKFFLIGIGIAALTEFGQLFIQGRACSLNDFFADLAGYFIIPIIGCILLEFLMEKLTAKYLGEY